MSFSCYKFAIDKPKSGVSSQSQKQWGDKGFELSSSIAKATTDTFLSNSNGVLDVTWKTEIIIEWEDRIILSSGWKPKEYIGPTHIILSKFRSRAKENWREWNVKVKWWKAWPVSVDLVRKELWEKFVNENELKHKSDFMLDVTWKTEITIEWVVRIVLSNGWKPKEYIGAVNDVIKKFRERVQENGYEGDVKLKWWKAWPVLVNLTSKKIREEFVEEVGLKYRSEETLDVTWKSEVAIEWEDRVVLSNSWKPKEYVWRPSDAITKFRERAKENEWELYTKKWKAWNSVVELVPKKAWEEFVEEVGLKYRNEDILEVTWKSEVVLEWVERCVLSNGWKPKEYVWVASDIIKKFKKRAKENWREWNVKVKWWKVPGLSVNLVRKKIWEEFVIESKLKCKRDSILDFTWKTEITLEWEERIVLSNGWKPKEYVGGARNIVIKFRERAKENEHESDIKIKWRKVPTSSVDLVPKELWEEFVEEVGLKYRDDDILDVTWKTEVLIEWEDRVVLSTSWKPKEYIGGADDTIKKFRERATKNGHELELKKWQAWYRVVDLVPKKVWEEFVKQDELKLKGENIPVVTWKSEIMIEWEDRVVLSNNWKPKEYVWRPSDTINKFSERAKESKYDLNIKEGQAWNSVVELVRKKIWEEFVGEVDLKHKRIDTIDVAWMTEIMIEWEDRVVLSNNWKPKEYIGVTSDTIKKFKNRTKENRHEWDIKEKWWAAWWPVLVDLALKEVWGKFVEQTGLKYRSEDILDVTWKTEVILEWENRVVLSNGWKPKEYIGGANVIINKFRERALANGFESDIRRKQSKAWSVTVDIVRKGVWERFVVESDLIKRAILEDKKEKISELKILLSENSDQRLEFLELVKLFWSDKATDVLYTLHPQYSVLEPSLISWMITNYLWDFLVERALPNFNIIPNDINLESIDISSHLACIIKENFVNYYASQRKQFSEKKDKQIESEYLFSLKEAFDWIKYTNRSLYWVLEEFGNELWEIFDIKKPEWFIDKISEGRSFPDFPQKLNAHEVIKHKRFLIADQMWLGKSASAILSKELLKENASTALCIIPANVIETWEIYLSSRSNYEKKSIGYFKKGKEPKVLIINSLRDLDYDFALYDYVLISQEKISAEGYIDWLKKQPYTFLLIDEVHKFKNISSGKGSQILLQLSYILEERDGYVCMLSGTPMPNTVKDICILLKLLYPEKFRDIDNKDLVRGIIHWDILEMRGLLLPRMQMKSLESNVDMPNLKETIKRWELKETELQIYEALLENNELTATEKIHAFSKLCIDSELLDAAPNIISSKMEMLQDSLNIAIKSWKKRIIVFANRYIEWVIRGENSLKVVLGLPTTVQIMTIHGESHHRRQIQDRFNDWGEQPIVLFVSGQTADVGIDLSGNDHQIFINEPWTQDEKNQQIGRWFRPGLKHNIESETLLIKGSLEEWIHEYIAMKKKAINKIIHGVPITELEKHLLINAEKTNRESWLGVNEKLAAFYMNRIDKLNKIFGYVSQGGVESVERIIQTYWKEYSECYKTLGVRSYQSNANRMNSAIIDQIANLQKAEKILDLGSGPKMLEKHIQDDCKHKVWSIDLNPNNFDECDERSIVGNFLKTPFEDWEFDIVSSSLALNETKFVPSKWNYERLEFFCELNRILKVDGIAVINSIYSLYYENIDKCKKMLGNLWFSVIEEFTGNAIYWNMYDSKVITLKKISNITMSINEIIEIFPDDLKWLKMRKERISLKNQRNILRQFSINRNSFNTILNSYDKEMLQEEESRKVMVAGLLEIYNTKESIPIEELLKNHLVRFKAGSKYALLSVLKDNGGIIVF